MLRISFTENYFPIFSFPLKD